MFDRLEFKPRPKPEPRPRRDVVTWSFGLLLTAISAIGIWEVLDIVSRARAGEESIYGGISNSTVVTVLMLLFGLRVLMFGHGPPPPQPGETSRKTPIRDALTLILFAAALLAGIGLKWWAEAELKALGYEEHSLLDGDKEQLRQPSWR